MAITGRGDFPFSSVWPTREGLTTEQRWGNTDQALKSSLNDWFFNTPSATVSSGNLNLFIHGKESLTDNLNLFISVKDNKNQSLDLFTKGFDFESNSLTLFISDVNVSSNSINLFINGPVFVSNNCNLFIYGFDNKTNDCDLIITGHDTNSGSIDLFVNGPARSTNDLDLFIKGYAVTLTNKIVSEEYEYSLGVSIIADFETGKNVTIELWQDGVLQVILSNICNEIGDTGKYSWSLSNISVINKNQARYFWRMTDDSFNIVEGTFILRSTEGLDGNMPSLNNKDDYILRI